MNKTNEINKVYVNEMDNVVEVEHMDSNTNTADIEEQNRNIEKDKMEAPSSSTQFVSRVLRKRTPAVVKPVKRTENSDYPLVIGGIKLRLQLKGLFSLDFDVPPQNSQWYRDFYNSFKDKYWSVVKKKRITNLNHKYDYDCLICGCRFTRLTAMTTHLNRHMGFYIARCQKCEKNFYSLHVARRHKIRCLKKN